VWPAVLALALVLGAGLADGAAPPVPPRQLSAAQARQVAVLRRQVRERAEAGDFAAALQRAEEVLALHRGWLGERHWLTTNARGIPKRWRRLLAVPARDRAEVGRGLALLNRVGQLHSRQRFAEGEKAARQALALFRRTLGESHPETGTAWSNVAYLLESQGKAAQAQPLYEKALAIDRQALGEDHPSTANACGNLATNLDAQGRHAQAQPFHVRALAARRKTLGERHPQTAVSLSNLAQCLAAQGRRPQAQPLLEQALAILRATRGDDHPDTGALYNNLAGNLEEQGRHREAQPLLEKALSIVRRAGGEAHPRTAQAWINLAGNLEQRGKAAQAQPLFEKALAICRQSLGEDHPGTARAYANLASNLASQGKYAEAAPLDARALAIRRAVLGEDHPATAVSYNHLGKSLHAQGRYADAQPLLEKALGIRVRLFGEAHTETVQSRINLAALLGRLGNHAAAREMLVRAIPAVRARWGSDHPLVADCCCALAHHYANRGDHAEGQSLYEKALAIRRRQFGDDHPRTADAYHNLAVCLSQQSKHAEAQRLFEQALAVRRRHGVDEEAEALDNRSGLATCLHHQGKYAEALPLLRGVLAARRKKLGEGHPRLANATNNLAACLWRLGRHGEAVRLWQASLPLHEVARLRRADTGFDRAGVRRQGFSAHAALAVGLARLGQPLGAFRHAEVDLARGLLDDLALLGEDSRRAAALDARLEALDEKLLALFGRASLTPTQREQREELSRQRREAQARLERLAADASAGRVLPLERIQRQLTDDEALVLWVNASVLEEYWACVVRRRGPPRWQRLPGSGKGGSRTDADWRLAQALHDALTEPASVYGARRPALALRRQVLDPLLPHLRAGGGLPAARRLLVAPTGFAGHLPVEVLAEEFRVSHAPSGSVLARLREQHRPLRTSPLLALGDPVFNPPTARLPEPPGHGLLLRVVVPAGRAHRAGLRSGDVLLRYGQKSLREPGDLKSGDAPVKAAYWREGREAEVRLEAGPLGVVVDPRPAPDAVRAWRQAGTLLAARGTGHRPLPGTRLEVQALARLTPGALVLLGSAASEQSLDQLNASGKLSTFRLLHLATHGEVNRDYPGLSRLVLAQDRLPDPVEAARTGARVYTGALTVDVIRRTWKLDADLVVLSACQTALGRDAGGEGLLGFAQAFLARGARSVVLSRWKVDDTATALLMLCFYENLLGKRPGLKAPLGRAEALRAAKRWLRGLTRAELEPLTARLAGGTLRGTEKDTVPLKGKAPPLPKGEHPFAHPYYWAAFVLVGDPD
jgi:tetratricopeptide (TPR) repeat protein